MGPDGTGRHASGSRARRASRPPFQALGPGVSAEKKKALRPQRNSLPGRQIRRALGTMPWVG